MSHAADQNVRIGRSYTRARRHPWVIGKIQGWTIPLGPYTATQLGVLIGGLFVLVQTFELWSQLGAAALIVIALPFAGTWAVRHAKIDGRTPLRALAGFVALTTEPRCGRIGGRLARDARPTSLTGGVRLSALPALQPASRQDTIPVSTAADRAAPRTAASSVPTARPTGPSPQGYHPVRQTIPARAARPHPRPPAGHTPERAAAGASAAAPQAPGRPAPTALQVLLAASRESEDS